MAAGFSSKLWPNFDISHILHINGYVVPGRDDRVLDVVESFDAPYPFYQGFLGALDDDAA